jgi:hypothetical protein
MEDLEYLTSDIRIPSDLQSHVQDLLLRGPGRVPPNYGGRAIGRHAANCVGDVGRLYRLSRVAQSGEQVMVLLLELRRTMSKAHLGTLAAQ